MRDDFPFHLLVTRGKDREQSPRSYNIVSKFVRDILESKDLEHIKTISASMRLFSRSEAHDATIRYRIVQDVRPGRGRVEFAPMTRPIPNPPVPFSRVWTL